MIHTNTKIIAGVSTAFLCVCMMVSFFFIQKVESQKDLHRVKAQERMHMLERERSLEALTQMLAETEGERETLTSRILQEEDVIDFLALVNSLGKEQGVALVTNALKVDAIDKDQTFEMLVVSIGLKGSYESVAHVVSLFEHIPYQSSLTKLRMTQDEDGEWSASFDLSVTKFKKV